MPRPVFMVIAESQRVREGLSEDLRRRFAADALAAASPPTRSPSRAPDR